METQATFQINTKSSPNTDLPVCCRTCKMQGENCPCDPNCDYYFFYPYEEWPSAVASLTEKKNDCNKQATNNV